MTPNSAGRCTGDGLFVASGQLFDDDVAGFALDQGEGAVSHVGAHDGVGFPMAELLSGFDLGRTLGDGALAGQNASRIEAAIAFAPEFADDAGVAPQIAAG